MRRGGPFFVVRQYCSNRYGDTIPSNIEKRLGLWGRDRPGHRACGSASSFIRMVYERSGSRGYAHTMSGPESESDRGGCDGPSPSRWLLFRRTVRGRHPGMGPPSHSQPAPSAPRRPRHSPLPEPSEPAPPRIIPPPEGKNPGLINEIGKIVRKKPASMACRRLKSPRETMDDAGRCVSAMDEISGRQGRCACSVAAKRGAPDSAKSPPPTRLAKARDFKEGQKASCRLRQAAAAPPGGPAVPAAGPD